MSGNFTASDLSDLPGFAEDDVASNEAGILSPGQRARRARKLFFELAAIVAFGALQVSADGFDLGTVIFLVAVAVWAVSWIRRASGVLGSTVSAADGEAWVEARDDSDETKYYLRIAGAELSTTQQVYRKLVSGGPYRAYYLPGTSELVSARRLEGWHPGLSPAPQTERDRGAPAEAVTSHPTGAV